MLIKKVWRNKGNGQKLVTIPSSSGLREGDHVKIEKVVVKEDDEE